MLGETGNIVAVSCERQENFVPLSLVRISFANGWGSMKRGTDFGLPYCYVAPLGTRLNEFQNKK